jgi:hypothetical protein
MSASDLVVEIPVDFSGVTSLEVEIAEVGRRHARILDIGTLRQHIPAVTRRNLVGNTGWRNVVGRRRQRSGFLHNRHDTFLG